MAMLRSKLACVCLLVALLSTTFTGIWAGNDWCVGDCKNLHECMKKCDAWGYDASLAECFPRWEAPIGDCCCRKTYF